MTITATIRPGERTAISGLPFAKDKPRANYWLLEDAINASRKGQVLYSGGSSSVARTHTPTLLNALVDRFGSVRVVHYGGQAMCVEACWKNGEIEYASTCEFSCAGANHGSKQPIGRIVSENGPAGSLSVSSGNRREYWIP